MSERSVGTWWRAYREGGREVLVVKRTRCPGPVELVSREERVLFQAMADYTSEELLIGGPLWARPLVTGLIRMVTGEVMSERGVGKWLRRHGFAPQRPARRSCRQRSEKVWVRLDTEHPAFSARARAEKAGWSGRISAGCGPAPRRRAGPGHRRGQGEQGLTADG